MRPVIPAVHSSRPFRRRSFPARLSAAPLVVGFAALAMPAAAQDVHQARDHSFRVVEVAQGLENAWGIAFLPESFGEGGEMLVTERPGRLQHIDAEGNLQEISGLPEVFASGQGGLLDVALHPAFDDNALVYISYSKPGDQGATTAVARARLEDGALTDLEDIFVADAWAQGRHFGGRIAFDGEGYLFLTIGDRGTMERSQDRSDHAGTTIRLHDDGSVPEGNPFVDEDGVLPEIYTYGNRNAQGMAIHPETGAVWQNEHGARGGDEINLIEAGKNYGWPLVTHGVDYSGAVIAESSEMEGMEPPLKHWTPSIAPSGMTFYTGEAFPDWQGDAFVGALASQLLARVRFDGTEEVEEEQLLEGYARIREVAQGPDGYIYLLLDEANAPLVRLEPAGS